MYTPILNRVIMAGIGLFSVLAIDAQSPLMKEPIKDVSYNANHSLPWKAFSILNNQWGLSKIKKGTFTQTVYTTENHAGWEWSSPRRSYGVIAYPEIWLGTSAWVKRSDIKEETYFKNITQLNEFKAIYDTEITVNHLKYNLAFDLWLHTEPFIAAENIGIELMVWEDYQKFKPFGKKIKTLDTPFGVYDLYTGKLNKKDLGLAWTYIAFVRHEKRTSGTVDLLYFLNVLQAMNLIKEAQYLSSVEFGTEVLNSTGRIFINDYQVIIQ